MLKRRFKEVTAILSLIILFSISGITKDLDFKVLSIDDVASYKQDRIVYQQVEYIIDPEEHQKIDTSISTLLLIRDKRMYLFKDGYDNPRIVEQNKVIKEMENRLIVNNLWERQINGVPDYIRITDRRVEVLRKQVLPGQSEEIIGKKYTDFYTKTRDSFIKRHVAIFKGLMINRKDSSLIVSRNPIPKKLNSTGPTKYAVTATAKTPDGKVYFAQDADGDGITETISVKIGDSFHWGFKSGPNVLLIFRNKQENIKAIIGDLTKIAYEGSPEEEKIILKQFDKLEVEIPKLIDDLIIMDLESKRVIDSSK